MYNNFIFYFSVDLTFLLPPFPSPFPAVAPAALLTFLSPLRSCVADLCAWTREPSLLILSGFVVVARDFDSLLPPSTFLRFFPSTSLLIFTWPFSASRFSFLFLFLLFSLSFFFLLFSFVLSFSFGSFLGTW